MNQLTTAPLHQSENMRLTISLDEDLYGFVKSLSKSEDMSMSEVINRLVRRVAEAPSSPIQTPHAAAPWATFEARPGVIVHPDEAQRMEEEEDLARLEALGFKK
jgi:hypothetical protein